MKTALGGRWVMVLVVGVAGAVWGEAGSVLPPRAEVDEGGLAPAQVNQSLTVNAYLGTVNGEPFFVETILRPIEGEMRRLARTSVTLSDFRAAAREAVAQQVESQISAVLVEKAAKESLTEEDTQRLEVFLAVERKKLLSQYQGSAARAEQDLRARGSSLDKELAGRRRGVIQQLYLHKVLWPKIVVTRKQIVDAYERNREKYTEAAEVELYTITLPISRWLTGEEGSETGAAGGLRRPTEGEVKEATAKALARGRELARQVKGAKAGEWQKVFADLAAENSVDIKRKDGGRWAHVRKGMLAWQAVEDAAFGLPAGGVGEPVLVTDEDPRESRVVVVKIGESKAARVVPFSEAQEGIEEKLREEMRVTLQNEFFMKLRQKAALEGVDKMVETVTEAAVARYAVKG